jgi:ABC-type nickel/cobalt efflux system permease component RcnA
MTLGFLIGLQHALEADHIAAVATLASNKRGFRPIVRHGAVWGLGHALTLGAFGGAVYALKLSLSAQLANGLELAVGVILAVLGGHVIYRVIRDRIHFHVHQHRGGSAHFHAHSHAGDVRPHAQSAHYHLHVDRSWKRSLGIGMMHGLAGSAALVALTASTAPSIASGLAFMLLFGLGSVLGMAVFSSVIAVPLSLTAGTLTWANRGLQVGAGLFALGFGLAIVTENAAALVAGF